MPAPTIKVSVIKGDFGFGTTLKDSETDVLS